MKEYGFFFFFLETILSPIGLGLLFLNVYLLYRYYTFVPSHNISSMNVHQEDNSNNSPLSYQDWTLEDLLKCNGVQSDRICLALDLRVYDVTPGRMYYGPGGSYHALAGRDASRALAAQELPTGLADNMVQSFDTLIDLTPDQRDILNEWIDFFDRKYTRVGTLVPFKAPQDEDQSQQEYQHLGLDDKNAKLKLEF